jgi:hypothetical protein
METCALPGIPQRGGKFSKSRTQHHETERVDGTTRELSELENGNSSFHQQFLTPDDD